ncbi:LysR family transcriptional regulator [Paenibacillus brasilensis]|uniref:DNA-binding transcriptional LysR family regulator n=1 Tax=Paenibacillus brasilensis TaxID=128574 RepID=A0ABU0L5H3_9BACL|nr:LysR family transcriptional regulator [Paenibacillus brasilensis]MDQ0496515.1 DNA-binding transcriptional LysR family regulator [Paenibacillus brasilensis]
MDIKQLQTFRKLAQELSFTRTAEALSYAASTVTVQIQSLEEELRQPLFERRGKTVTLTEPGIQFSLYAEKVLALLDEAKAVLAHGEHPAGMLIIGALDTLCAYRMPPVINRLHERYPNIELVFRAGVCPDLTRALAQELDAALVLDLQLSDEQLVVEVLREEEILIVANKKHPLSLKEIVGPQDLKDVMLLMTRPTCRYRQLFTYLLAEHGVPLNRKMEFDSIEAIKQCAISGLGVAVLPQMAVAAEIEKGLLQPLNLEGHSTKLYTQVVFHKDKWISPALRVFLDEIRDLLKVEVSLDIMGSVL